MRVFSLAAALLLAATSLAAASPVALHNNNGPTQEVVNIISTANDKLLPLSQQLTAAVKASDAEQFGSAVSQINTVVSDTAGQLKPIVPQVDITSANLAILDPVVSILVNLLSSILFGLIPAVKFILGTAANDVLALVGNLLTSVSTLASFLQPFGVSTFAGVLNPVLNLLYAILNTVGGLLGLPV